MSADATQAEITAKVFQARIALGLKGPEALAFVAALNAQPPVTEYAADEVQVYIAPREAIAMAALFKDGCRVTLVGMDPEVLDTAVKAARAALGQDI